MLRKAKAIHIQFSLLWDVPQPSDTQHFVERKETQNKEGCEVFPRVSSEKLLFSTFTLKHIGEERKAGKESPHGKNANFSLFRALMKIFTAKLHTNSTVGHNVIYGVC